MRQRPNPMSRVLALALAACAPMHLSAQTPDKPVFDVASIKPTSPDVHSSMIQPMTGGGLRVEGVNLKVMLAWAYQVQNYQISGGPPWVDSTACDYLAKPSGTL